MMHGKFYKLWLAILNCLRIRENSYEHQDSPLKLGTYSRMPEYRRKNLRRQREKPPQE